MVHLPLIQRSTRRSRGRVAGFTVAVLIATGAVVGAAPISHSAPVGWSSSFESASDLTESQRYEPTDRPAGYQPDQNVTGRNFAAKNLTRSDTTVSASSQNGSGEGVSKLIDGDITTKWLAPENSAWVQFDFGTARTVDEYTMTTSNDFWTRNPRNWELQGSANGQDWLGLDTQRDQLSKGDLSPEYFSKYRYPVPAAKRAAYRFYRLNITANNGAPNIQLADVELIGAHGTSPAVTPMSTTITNGPVFSNTAKTQVGYTGTHALQYRVQHPADSPARATNVVKAGLSIPIGAEAELGYKIFPHLNGDVSTYGSASATIDAVYTDADGSHPRLLSDNSALSDQYGFGISPTAQAAARTLWPDQWNAVRIDLAPLRGKVITAVLVHYDKPDATIADIAMGWFDDIKIGVAAPIDGSSLTNYVDTRRGTNSSGSYSRGNTFPATAWPNGFNFFTPFTDGAARHDPYSWQQNNTAANRPQLQGLGISHQPTRWGDDRTQLLVMPSLSTAATPDASLTARQLEFGHENEVAQPDEYQVDFDNGIRTRVAPTDHAGVFQFTFPASATRGTVFVDRGWAPSSRIVVSGANVSGWIDDGSHIYGKTRMYFSGSFDREPVGSGMASGRTSAQYATFDASQSKTVELRIATSLISVQQAQRNLRLEVLDKGWSYSDVQSAAQQTWNERLSVIDLTSSATATDVERVNTYSNLYKLNMYPNSQFENTGTALNPVYKYASPVTARTGLATDTNTNAEIRTGKMYVNNGFWDTYHTAWPLYSMLYPGITAELVDGFVEQYRAGGWISRWSSPGYANSMTGTNSDAAFADAYSRRAVPAALAKEAYAAALRNATVVPRSEEVGRKVMGIAPYLGYTPVDQDQSVSWTIEGAINDFAIARMAEGLADEPGVTVTERTQYLEMADYLKARSKDYANIFDARVGDGTDTVTPLGFFTGRDRAGAFAQQPGDYLTNPDSSIYDPEDWDEGREYNGTHFYTETNGWNFAFLARHDVDGMAALYGGTAGLVAKLDTFFGTPELAKTRKIHETYEARDTRLGQWGASNQVSFPIPYLYAAAGKPSRTQAIMRDAMSRLYVGSEIGQGFPGDEDNGAMASFQIFGALGFYPLVMGSGELVLGSPTFDTVTLRPLGTTSSLTVRAADNSRENVYVQSAMLDGTVVKSAMVDEASLTSGNHVLSFEMGATPSTWGERTRNEGEVEVTADVVDPATSAIAAPGTVNVAALFDNRSSTAAELPASNATVEVRLPAPTALTSYTITTSTVEGAAAPRSWRLEGSVDGVTWQNVDVRSDETFPWTHQLRPFSVAPAKAYSSYRLLVTKTSTGAGAEIGELQLLSTVAATTPSQLRLTPQLQADAVVGAPVTTSFATIVGAGEADLGNFTASVAVAGQSKPATVSRSGSHLVVTAPSMKLMDAGQHDAVITVRAAAGWSGPGSSAVDMTTRGSVTVRLDDSTAGHLARAANIVCFTYVGDAGDCDGNGWAVDLDSIQSSGTVFGAPRTVKIGSSTFTYTVTAKKPGAVDTLIPAGQVIPVQLNAGATAISLIGTANEGQKSTQIKLHYTDGPVQTETVTFGDWVTNASSPASGNTIALRSSGRVNQNVRDTATTGFFASLPIALSAGRTLMSIELASKSGNLKPEGQVHIIALADNGNLGDPIAAKAVPSLSAVEGTTLSANLATVTGGRGNYSATVNWGDGTGLHTAEVVNGAVQARHTVSRTGTYDAVITISDSERSVNVVSRLEVTPVPTIKPPDPTPVRLSAPKVSKSKQAHGSVKARRAVISTVVAGATSGTVTFVSEGKVLGRATVKMSGDRHVATLRLPAAQRIGIYKSIRATITVQGAVTSSPLAARAIRVVKAEPGKVGVKVSPRVKAGKKTSQRTVRVSIGRLTSGQWAKGRVRILVGKKAVGTRKITAARKGKISIVLPKKYGKGTKIRAQFIPTTRGTVTSRTSKVVRA